MNITIRKMQPGDADALYRLLSDPEVMRHLEPPFDREQAEAFLHHTGLLEPPLVYAAEANGEFITRTMRTAWKSAGCCSRNIGGAAMRRR